MDPSSPAELSVKYQRLAAEYSKMRAQNNVLKKAVLEEQGKNSILQDELQLKDQTIRKSDQEIDSLSFRNTQLEKRVGFLQEDLAKEINKAKIKNKGKSPSTAPVDNSPSDPKQSPLDFELISKIEENMQLHKQISEMEETHRREIGNLKGELQDRMRESPVKKLQGRVDSLESEKLSLTYSLQNSLDEIEAYRDQVYQLQDKIRNLMLYPERPNSKANSGPQLAKSQSEDLTGSYDSSKVTEMRTLQASEEDSSIPDLVEKLTSAEQQKEHLMLEYQLLKMKYSKIFMKWEEAKQILKSLGKEDLMSGDITPSTETVQSFTTMVGKIDVISDDPQSWGRSYEKEVKDYLMTRINELIAQLQLSESKVVTFYAECVSMQNLLEIAEDRKKEAESRLEELKAQHVELQEELQLTKNNYESQLSTMTEHLATMNERLAQQKDQIDELNYMLTNKGSGKSKK